MSFETSCSTCGAPSGPSVGVCPYCKTPFTSVKPANPALSSMRDAFQQGRLQEALAQGSAMKNLPKYSDDGEFLVLWGKVLFESEGPGGTVASIFAKAAAAGGDHADEAQLYFLISAANSELRRGLNDPGENKLQTLLQSHPQNPHILFTLGTHLFWVDQSSDQAMRYLELCVQARPAMPRAWGCLFAIHKSRGDKVNMKRCRDQFLKYDNSEDARKLMDAQMAE